MKALASKHICVASSKVVGIGFPLVQMIGVELFEALGRGFAVAATKLRHQVF